MPQYGPRPKQFSQAGATPGEPITAQPISGTDASKASPAYSHHATESYLNLVAFNGFYAGSPGLDVLAGTAPLVTDIVFAGTQYPDFDDPDSFDVTDVFGAVTDGQTISGFYAGRLASFQTTLSSVSINVIGDSAGATDPPQFRIRIAVDGAASSNPVYNSGFMDAPSVITEFIIVGAQLSEQPTIQGRYHVIVDTSLDANQTVRCSRPFVRQE